MDRSADTPRLAPNWALDPPPMRICVGTTFSPASYRIVETAGALAESLAAALLLVHVAAPGEPPAAVEQHERRLRSQADRFASGVRATHELRTDREPWRGLLRELDPAADLLVVGVHESDGVLGKQIGSASRQLVRHAELPLLLIRGRGPHPPGRRPPTAGTGPAIAAVLGDEASLLPLPPRGGLQGWWHRRRLLRRVERAAASVLLVPTRRAASALSS